MIYICTVCGFKYDESKEKIPFDDLPGSWVCPVCGVGKELFRLDESSAKNAEPQKPANKKPAAEASDTPSPAKTASDILVETLSNWGVKWVFGMVGHSNLGTSDAVRRLTEKGDMNFIGIRHEGAAAFACSTYGKLTERPAACITIAGPGATNLMTGIYDAKLDRAPLVALMGQVPLSQIGRFSFQEVELVKPFADSCDFQYQLSTFSNIGEMASKACKSAIERKSPSQIILPDDMQVAQVADAQKAGTTAGFSPSCDISPSFEEAEAAAYLIKSAKKPVLIIGEGCLRSMKQVLEFAETFSLPVATTYRAKGFLPDSHPLSCGVLGVSGTTVAAKIIGDSDLIIGLGMGFSKHTLVPDGKKILQIDIRKEALGRLKNIDCGLVGGVAQTLPMLTYPLRGKTSFVDRRGQIAEEWRKWKAEKAKRAATSKIGAISPAAACEALNKYVADDALISVDVGNVSYDFGRYFEAKKQRITMSFYLGSIGIGLPGAMGAWCATQERGGEFAGRQVVAVVGDGGLGQYLADWTTVARHNMDIKLVVFNNSELAKISLEQRSAHMRVWKTSLTNPSFAEYAKICGTNGVRIDDPADLDEKIKGAMSAKGPAIIEIITQA